MEILSEWKLKNPDFTWYKFAACAGAPTEVFFPGDGKWHEAHKEALEYCGICPVRDECANFALTNSIKHGIWGGMSYRQRRRHKARKKKATK